MTRLIRITESRESQKSLHFRVFRPLPISKDDRFFILGLAPNIARISVVYWSELPLKEFAAILLRHFDDMDIVDSRKDKNT